MSGIDLPNVGSIQLYAHLRRVVSIPEPDRPAFFVHGNTGVADAGMGLFGWSPTSTDADDNDTVLKPDDRPTAAGRWLKL